MSYCVHCGVELDASLKKCPLCQTPVLDPNVIPYYETTSPYPPSRGQVEQVKRKDIAIVITSLLIATSITCGLLNQLAFPQARWSLIVTGTCMLIWVLCIPLMIYRKISTYLAVFLDGSMVAIYLYMISQLTTSKSWCTHVALPITALCTGLILLSMFLYHKYNRAIFYSILYFFVDLAILCTAIELLYKNYAGKELGLTWSAVVLTVCAIFSITILVMLSRPRLREAARRRLHF